MTFSQVFDAVVKGHAIRRTSWHAKRLVTMGEKYLQVTFDYETGEKVIWSPTIKDLYIPNGVDKFLVDDWEVVKK